MRQEALKQYLYAQKLGQKFYRSCVVRGSYPYPQVLNEVFSENMGAGHVQIGLVDIPADQIVGTTTVGRRSAFAGNFMPLLQEGTEFANKWVSLCEAHLGDNGITEPIVCFEYMGRFYVTEGNKRVSVLKSYGAPTIAGNVTRIVPAWSEDDENVQIYYEFMPFYQLSGVYDVMFTRRGSYAKLQAMLGFEPEHVWTREERADFLYDFRRFKEVFEKQNAEKLPITAADAFLVWLEVNPYSEMSKTDLQKTLAAAWPDIRIFANGSSIELSTEPVAEEKQGVIPRVLGIGKVNHLNIAFVHAFDPEHSSWTAAHDEGRMYMEERLGDRVSVRSYLSHGKDPLEVMEQAVAEGAQILFATTPPLIGACRQIAVRHPQVKVLNCSLSMPYAGVRTYYSRIFEGKFVTGAVAGAMAKEDRIGYVANYPIIGTIAAINAFALGARLTNPHAKIVLRWSCMPGDPVQSLLDEGIRVISNRDSAVHDPRWAWEWGTYMVESDGALKPLASPRWNWGKFYVGVVQSVFDGTWNALNTRETAKAVNYWWGMSSGVIDVSFSPSLPEGARQMGRILKQGVVAGTIDPFGGVILDNKGNLRNEGNRPLTAEEIMNMDWLAENVDGYIPAYEELLPVSQQLVRHLGLYRDQIPPQHEEGMQ